MKPLSFLIVASLAAATPCIGLQTKAGVPQTPAKPGALAKVENPSVVVTSSGTLKVVSSKTSYSVAGPTGSTFQFQPTVPKDSGFQTASLQVNGVDVAVGQFTNGKSPVLGYRPSSPLEIAIYRAAAPGKDQILATYKIRTDGAGLHPMPLMVDADTLSPVEKRDGTFLIFGPSGCLGMASQRSFSVPLSAFPSGPNDFASVYVNGDYAEAPVVTHAMLKPRIEVEGLEQPVNSTTPVSVHVKDALNLGIKSIQVLLNGRELGNFDDWKPSINFYLSSVRPGLYVLSFVGKLSDGSAVGPETFNLEVTNDVAPRRPVESPPTIQDITIRSAWYGSGGQNVDVTQKVRDKLASGTTTIQASDSTFGDPALGQRKKLIVDYSVRGNFGTLSCEEDDSVDLNDAIRGFGNTRANAATNQLLDNIVNGSFDTLDTSSFTSEMKYVPAGTGVLDRAGVYTIAYGVMRPFQLHPALRLDFVQRTSNPNSGAMFINPVPGRQPVMLWSERVKVEPNTVYKFQCYCADVSDNSDSAWASIALQADTTRSDEVLLTTGDEWKKVSFNFRTGPKGEVNVRIWRDVLPAFAESGSLIAIDDISLVKVSGNN